MPVKAHICLAVNTDTLQIDRAVVASAPAHLLTCADRIRWVELTDFEGASFAEAADAAHAYARLPVNAWLRRVL